MRFSEAFGISMTAADDWFDPHLTIDTPLFLDPFLLLKAGGTWKKSHAKLVRHFAHAYKLVAKATSPNSLSARTARSILTFPEPYEFGLGYTQSGTRGSGSGGGYANRIADGVAVSIAAGLTQPEHIEEIGILNEGFGADRISDAACNVLKDEFIAYTREVVQRHNLPTETFKIRRAGCDLKQNRWLDAVMDLPRNPETGDPVLLLPRRLLNDLPVLNADDWFDSSLNDDIRNQLNLKVGQHVAKRHIVEFARQRPERVRDWARQQTSRGDLSGYDFEDDPKGVANFDGPPLAFAMAHALQGVQPPNTQEELSDLVRAVLEMYKHFLEQQGGWQMLWNSDGSEKPESAAQLMFVAMAQHYLRLFDVEVDREVDLGRGPVDFKISSGSSKRLLIEIKKAHNGKFWNGLEQQLPSYLVSDQATEGWFLAIRYRNNRASEDRMKELPDRVKQCSASVAKTLRYMAVDARRPLSASKLTSDST